LKKKPQNIKTAMPHKAAPSEHKSYPSDASITLSRPKSCVWSQGRLNLRRLCDQDGRCAQCALDKALQESAEKNREARRQGKIPLAPDGRIAFTRERLQLLPKGERPCLLYANGLIDYKICCKDYECVFCEFDRYFSEQHQVHAVVRPLDVLNIRGFRMPQGYYYHRGHTWVRVAEKAEVNIGLDDFALQLLGPLESIETPRIGNEVVQGKPVISIGRGAHQAAVRSPVGGVISAINLAVKDNAALAAEDPYAGGWILKVHTENLRQDLKHLLIGSEYAPHLEQDIQRLIREIEMTSDAKLMRDLAAENDISRHLPDIGWVRLKRLFLEV